MLLKKIPSEKIQLSKKIVTFDQNQDGITVIFDDNTTARGDILVGADGAHGAVRKHLYATLEKESLLSKADTEAMSKGFISLDGTTNELDPVKYPMVTFTIPDNRICWNVIIQLGLSSTADEQATSSDWTSQNNKKMLDEIRHFKTPYGTMGDLFDATDIENVSKIYFEDELFET
ncbi:hypothetical protein BGZ88_012154 [Linnemannia elongata]|nr:hypothetical protein BGZ88_012154 [Linnemannia elongata]